MVRFSVKYDTKYKKYDWTCKDNDNLGVLIIETNKGVVYIPNYPEEKLVKVHVLDSFGAIYYYTHGVRKFVRNTRGQSKWTNYIKLTLAGTAPCMGYKDVEDMQKRNLSELGLVLLFMWYNPDMKMIYNPVRKSWIYFNGNEQSEQSTGAWSYIEYDLLQYAFSSTSTAFLLQPEIDMERETVEQEFEDISESVDMEKKESPSVSSHK